LLLRSTNAGGFKHIVLGERVRSGRWYFFPVALSVKTPLPFLLLTVVGAVTLMSGAVRRRSWADAAPVVMVLGFLVAAVPSNITIGVRHVLPIYGPLAVLAAAGVRSLWRAKMRFRAGMAIAAAAVTWQVVDSARAHPDYLAYFNQLAGAHPERVLIDSDLDWGQDLDRLAQALRARGITQIAVSIYTTADLKQHGLPEFTELGPNRPVTGWVAISAFRLHLGYLGNSPFDDFAWLRQHTPVERVGKSIYLYYVH
jgi:hypothetical protein